MLSFDVPRDSPSGGMELAINFTLTNPSFASFYLPTINFGMYVTLVPDHPRDPCSAC